MGLLLRRGLEVDRLSFVPQEGELIYVTDTKLIYVGDGTTPGGILVAGGTSPPPAPTYELTSSSSFINEGANVNITLTTTNVPNGTLVPYTITGNNITPSDLGLVSLSGTFVVNSNISSLSLLINSDNVVEGLETFVLSLDSITPTTSVTINVIETIFGGDPSTEIFNLVIEGGNPSTIVFDGILDGGSV